MKKGRFNITKAKYIAELYKEAVDWIAINVEPTCLDPEIVMTLISVQLIADILRRGVEGIALDIVAERERMSKKEKVDDK